MRTSQTRTACCDLTSVVVNSRDGAAMADVNVAKITAPRDSELVLVDVV
jgi:hypothetical protein